MKRLQELGRELFGRIQSWLRPETGAPAEDEIGRGENLIQLQETQNRVIQSVYRISIFGLAAIFLILVSFTAFMLTDPATPAWMSYLLAAVEVLLVMGFIRTLKDFRTYQKHYLEVSARLRELLRLHLAQAAASRSPGRGGEYRLLDALKPKEHEGWDAKTCRQCEKTIEMTATVCQHCGEDQEQVYMS